MVWKGGERKATLKKEEKEADKHREGEMTEGNLVVRDPHGLESMWRNSPEAIAVVRARDEGGLQCMLSRFSHVWLFATL